MRFLPWIVTLCVLLPHANGQTIGRQRRLKGSSRGAKNKEKNVKDQDRTWDQDDWFGQSEYDYIIVGAGAGGSLAARALVQQGAGSVLLIERGLPRNKVPTTFTGSTWPQVVNDPHAAELMRFTSGVWGAVARVEGGGTSLNDGLYLEETPDYFQEAFGFAANSSDQQIIYSGYGLAEKELAFPTSNSTLANAYTKSILQAGRGPILNGEDQVISYEEASTNEDPTYTHRIRRIEDKGTWLAYSTFDLQEKSYPRFPASDTIREFIQSGQITLATEYTVDKVVIGPSQLGPTKRGLKVNSSLRATGVVMTPTGNATSNSSVTINARKGVILSAGTIYTPYLLMKSGIGPAKELEKFPDDIDPKIVNEYVGQEFIDRPVLNFALTLNGSAFSPSLLDAAQGYQGCAELGNVNSTSALQCVSRFLGRAVSTDAELKLFFESVGGDSVASQFAIATGAFVPPKDRSPALLALLSLIFNNIGIARAFTDNSIEMFTLLFNPKSRGNVTLSDNLSSPPLVSNNMYGSQEDIDNMIVGARQVINATLQPAWDGLRRTSILSGEVIEQITEIRNVIEAGCSVPNLSCITITLTFPNLSMRECVALLEETCTDLNKVEELVKPVLDAIGRLIPDPNAPLLGPLPTNNNTKLRLNSMLLPVPPEYDSRDSWTEWIKNSQISAYHYFGTASSGKVVDPEQAFRVYGTQNLYVADASIFPEATRVNPQASVMAMGYYVGTRVAQIHGNE